MNFRTRNDLELPEYTSSNPSHDQLKCLSMAAELSCSGNPLDATVILGKIRAILNSDNRSIISPICDAILMCACSNAHDRGKPNRESSKIAKVYFIQRQDGMIKIGYAKDVNKRIAQLRGPNGSELTALLILDGGSTLETALHKKFAQDNHFGEWFNPSSELLAYIGMHQLDQAETEKWSTTSIKIENKGKKC